MLEVAPTVAMVATTELCHRAGCFRSSRSFVPFVETFDGGRLSELELSLLVTQIGYMDQNYEAFHNN